MKKIFALFFIFICGLVFSQISEISKIDKEVANRYSKISKKDKRKFPEQSRLEEAKIEDYRNEEYKKAIQNIQKDEVKVDLNSVEKNPTKSAEYESGINGFRKLFSENFDTSIIDADNSTYKTDVQKKEIYQILKRLGLTMILTKEQLLLFTKSLIKENGTQQKKMEFL